MKLLVCGGRDYADRDLLYSTLDAAVQYARCTEIICGYDPDNPRYQGADQMAFEWAIWADFPCRHFPANWKKHRRAAGPIRNSEMAADKPDECVAFPRANGEWGTGTLDMIGKAARAGATVHRVERPADHSAPDHCAPKEPGRTPAPEEHPSSIQGDGTCG